MRRRNSVALCLATLLTLVLLAGLGWSDFAPRGVPLNPGVPTPRYLVGADYLTTFPEDFQKGTLRLKLIPSQLPQLRLYDSADLQVVETQIDWAAEYGIDFFVLAYSPTGEAQNLRLQLFPYASNISDIHFCLSYPLVRRGAAPKESDAAIPKVQLVKDLEGIAENFLVHRQYLKVAGRPVVVLSQTSRLKKKELVEAIRLVRETLRAKGYDVFLIGDEGAWPEPERSENSLSDRVVLLDAVTTHDLLTPPIEAYSGYGDKSSLLKDVLRRHHRLVEASQGAVPVLPAVFPGLNSRGGLIAGDPRTTPIIPRSWKSEGSPQGFLTEMLERYALRSVDPRVPIILVNSWNDWGRDTAIEPLQAAPPSSNDVSGRQLYTGGYSYAGYGTALLELIRDKVVAVSGRLLDEASGEPLSGVAVAAWQDGESRAVAVSDSRGRFRFSRLTLRPGDYRVGVTYAESVDVTVEPEMVAKAEIEGHLQPLARKPIPIALEPLFPNLRVGLAKPLAGAGHPKTPNELEKALQAARQPAITALISRSLSPGQSVVEVGAGDGAYSILAASVVGSSGRVYAFEANRRKFGELIANAKLAKASNVEPLWYALGERIGWLSGPDGTVVERRTLDSFHLPKIGLLVVEDQGTDEEPLLGARDLLRVSQPKIMLHVVGEPARRRYVGDLASLGYRSVPIQGTEFLLAVPFGLGRDQALLDLGSRFARQHLKAGFSIDEHELSGNNFVWGDDVESSLELPLALAKPIPYVLGIRGKAYQPISPIQIQVLVNGARAGDIEMVDQWTGAELEIPDGLLVEGMNTVLLRYSRTGRPSGLNLGNLDNRALSVAFDRVWLCPLGLDGEK